MELVIQIVSDAIFNGNWSPLCETVVEDPQLVPAILKDATFTLNFRRGAFLKPLSKEAELVLAKLKEIDADWLDRNYYAEFAQWRQVFTPPSPCSLVTSPSGRGSSSSSPVFPSDLDDFGLDDSESVIDLTGDD